MGLSEFLALTARQAWRSTLPSGSGDSMILSAIVEKLKRRSKDDFKGRHLEASLILGAARSSLAAVAGVAL